MNGRDLDVIGSTVARVDRDRCAPKVVHVITGLGNGGAEGALFRLCTHPDIPTSMVISLMDEGVYGARLRKAGVDVVCLSLPKGRLTLRGLAKLLTTLRRVRPEVVQTWMYHADLLGGIAARLAGIDRIYWGIRTTSPSAVGSSQKVAKLCSLLSKFIPYKIICCAKEAAVEHVKMGYDGSRMCVINNGFDFERFQIDPRLRQEYRSKFGFSHNDPILGFVARFSPEKDHANLFNALGIIKVRSQCPRVLLIGPGMTSDNAELMRLIVDAGLQSVVHLVGPQLNIPAIMNTLDIHVMSSQHEGFPNVLVEAMSCGCPCISTDVGAAGYIVGGTGWIVPPKDSEALAQAIIEALALMGTPDWTDRRTFARDRAVSRFGITKMVEHYRKVWGL